MSSVSSFEGETRKPKGAVLFTGPDGIGDFKARVREQRFIGHGCMSPEASSDTQYLYRAAKDCPPPPPKTARVGEIGWGVPQLIDHSLLKTGHQIMIKEFRQLAEDRHTHLYQNPYYPPPPSKGHTPQQEGTAQQSSQPTSMGHAPQREETVRQDAEEQRSIKSTESLHSKGSTLST